MARAIVTIRLMPESTDSNLKKIEQDAKELIEKNGGEFGRCTDVPIAFGLRALDISIIIDENLGSEVFENALSGIESVASSKVTDFRRAMG